MRLKEKSLLLGKKTMTNLDSTLKTRALTRWTFVDKVMSLLFNMLSRYNFSCKEQASFNFMAEVIISSDFGVQENKVSYCFHCFPIYLP